MANVVVGVDGSHTSKTALEWAARYARMSRNKLVVVRVHEPVGDPSAATLGSALAYSPTLSSSEQGHTLTTLARERAHTAQQGAQERIGQQLRRMLREADVSGVEIETAVIADRRPSRVLEDYSRYAELLVVGSRGMGGVKGMLLGSVSQHVTQHSACPVVVIPAPSRTRRHVRHRS